MELFQILIISSDQTIKEDWMFLFWCLNSTIAAPWLSVPLQEVLNPRYRKSREKPQLFLHILCGK